MAREWLARLDAEAAEEGEAQNNIGHFGHLKKEMGVK
jgi:hypothetical protein